MASTDKLKQSLYFPEDLLREIMREAVRLDRSLSWTAQQAWRAARDEIRKFPSVDRRAEADRAPRPPPAQQRRADAGQRDASQRDAGQRDADSERRQPSSQVRDFLRGKFDHEATT